MFELSNGQTVSPQFITTTKINVINVCLSQKFHNKVFRHVEASVSNFINCLYSFPRVSHVTFVSKQNAMLYSNITDISFGYKIID